MKLHSTDACIAIVLLLGCGRLAIGQQSPPQAGQPDFEVLPADLVKRLTAIRERALKESKAYEHLAALTSEVGPRFAGSANDRLAVEWAVRRFQQLGFRNVRAEEVTVPCWQRGEAVGEITSPVHETLTPLALGGSVATPPDGINAEVIDVSGLEQLAQLDRSKVAGKIVFFSQRMIRDKEGIGYAMASPKRRSGPARAAAKGAVAVLIRSVGTSNTNLVYTGMTHYEQGVPKIPAAALSNPDADLLAARIRDNPSVRFKLRLDCRYRADAKSANVIGEVPGRDLADEVVLLVAHLDSWDVGQGALDDGAGCAIVTEVARLISELHPAPRRTIRVLLAANEEFGLTGALDYSKRHADEMNNHVLGVEADFGADRVWLMRSRVAKEKLPVVPDLALLLAPLGVQYSSNPTLGGADLLPLARYQLPVLEMRHDGTRYFDAYHSSNDTLDKVDPENVTQCVAAYAVVALAAAEIEGGFGRAPKFRGQLPSPFSELLRGEPPFR
jgi:carboxypeptidase Q